MLMLTKVVELKAFHGKWKSQRVLIAFYYLFIRSLLLWTHEQQCKKKKQVKLLECDHTLAESKCHEKFDI